MMETSRRKKETTNNERPSKASRRFRASCQACDVVAHTTRPTGEFANHRYIHKLPRFAQMTCFEIAHDAEFQEMYGGSWKIRPTSKLYKQLRGMHGLEETLKRKNRARGTQSVANEETHEEEEHEESHEDVATSHEGIERMQV